MCKDDERREIAFVASKAASRPQRLDVGGLFSHAITDRPNDEDATSDQVDYDRLVVFVGVAASF